MSIESTLVSRKAELARRVRALPEEVKKWRDRTSQKVDSNLHFSQLQAIGLLIDTFAAQQKLLIDKMDPVNGQATYYDTAYELVKNIIRSQRFWDYFRDKLDLRFSPLFKDVLWVADTVAWDCYRPVLANATDAGIINANELREPPLTYLTAEFSPATWTRGSRPNDGHVFHLETTLLPIPVIELPWDHVQNIWEFMSLHHEVGHDLEADLGLKTPLRNTLQTLLTDQGIPASRIEVWQKWRTELFCDLVALQLGGSPFAEALMHMLLLPASLVTALNEDDPHPAHYPRILLNAAYIPTLIAGYPLLVQDAEGIVTRWKSIYGEQPQFDDFLNDAPWVFQALMDTPLPELKGMSVRQLMPYLEADDIRIRDAAGYMRTGMNNPGKNLKPRHCISAARLALTQAAQANQLTDELCNKINKRTSDLVHTNAPAGLRGDALSTPRKQYLATFVDNL